MAEFEEKDLCILCNSPPSSSPGSRVDNSKRRDHHSNRKLFICASASASISENEEADLLPQLRVVFLLQQIFKHPLHDESMFKVMRKLGDPSGWFQICDGCSDLVDHGMNVLRKLKMVEAQYSEIRKKLERKVSLSKTGSVEDEGMMGRNELTGNSRIRVDLRNKLRGGIEAEMTCEIKSEPVPDVLLSDLEDHWAPCEDVFDGDSSEEERSPSFHATPHEAQKAMLVAPSDQETEMTNRPHFPDRPEMGTEKPNQTRQSTRTRKPRYNLDDLEQESESDEDDKYCIKSFNLKPKIRTSKFSRSVFESKGVKKERKSKTTDQKETASSSFDHKPEFPLIDDDKDKDYHPTFFTSKKRKAKVNRIKDDDEYVPNLPLRKRHSTGVTKGRKYKKSATDAKEITAPSIEQEDVDKEGDPNFRLSDDYQDKVCRPSKKRKKTAKKSNPPQLDNKLFLATVYECLDMSLIEYPAQTEEDKAKIPKLLKEANSKAQLNEEGQSKFGSFPCPSCKKKFTSRFFAIAHIHRFHFGIARPWRCNQCTFTAATTRVMRRHLLGHQHGTLKVCTICNFSCQSKRNFDTHFINHHKGKANLACSECKVSFVHFTKYVRHMINEHGFEYPYPVQNPTKKIVCELCSKMCMSPRSLEFHKLQRHNESPSKKFPECSECSRIFFNESSLRNHMDARHHVESSPAFFCEHCGKGCRNLELLNCHIAFRHVEEPKPCRVCGMEQRNSIDLRKHMHRNHNEVFGKSPEEQEEYAKRMREEMAFQCPLCPEKFAFRVQLYHHYRTNHEEVTNKFKCDVCGKGFSRQSSVKRHYESNHMQLKVNCEDCGKAFPKDNLWQHRNKSCPVKKQREQEGPPPIPEMKINVPVEKGTQDHQEPGPSLEMEFKEWFQLPVVSNVLHQDNCTAGTHVLDMSRFAP